MSCHKSVKMEIEPPEVLKKPLHVPYRLLMGPGPANCSPRVMKALVEPVLGVMHEDLFKIMDEVKEGIKYVFQTKNELTLALTTAGHGGMEAVFCNLIEPGDKVLIAVNGIWGIRAKDIATRYGGIVTTVKAPVGDNLSFAQIEQAVARDKPKLLFIVQGESSTGIYQPIEGLGDICRRYNCLLAVDAVASLGSTPMFQDKWKIDALYTGSQKILGAPPGLAPISFSKRAQEVIFTRKTSIAVFYLDVKLLGEQWNCYNNVRTYHHTMSSQIIYALREALAQIAEEGLEHVIKRHGDCARRLYVGLQKMNLNFFVENENKRLPSITAIHIPPGIDLKELAQFAYKKYSVDVIGGLGPTAGKIIRIGLMGYNATPQNVDIYLAALKEGIENQTTNRNSKL